MGNTKSVRKSNYYSYRRMGDYNINFLSQITPLLRKNKKYMKYKGEVTFNSKDWKYQKKILKHKINEEEQKWLKTENGFFFKACFENDVDKIKLILNNKNEIERYNLYQKSTNKFIHFFEIISQPTPIEICCINGCLEALKLLLEEIKIINVNSITNKCRGYNILHSATYFKQMDIMYFLMEKLKINPHLNNKHGEDCLKICSRVGCFEGMKYLIENKFMNLQDYNCNGEYNLLLCSKFGNVEGLKFLIEKIKINLKEENYNEGGGNYLQICSKYGNLEGMKFLIDQKGMNPYHHKNSSLLLHIYSRVGSLEGMKYLIEIKGMNPRIFNYGENCLHICSRRGYLEGMKYLIEERGMNPNEKTENGYNCLYLCIQKSENLDGMKYLLSSKIKMNPQENIRGQNYLHLCSEFGNLKGMKYLIDKPCEMDPEKQDRKRGENCLHISSRIGDFKTMKFLIEKKEMDVSKTNKKLENCLHLNIDGNTKISIIKYLLEKEVPLSLNIRNESALHIACRRMYRKEAIQVIEKYVHSKIKKFDSESSFIFCEIQKKIKELHFIKGEYNPTKKKLKKRRDELRKYLE